MAIAVSHADRMVFPDIGKTKGDVVNYYEQLGERMLPHVRERPLSIKRYPQGLGGSGFFQKNVPPHYPESIARVPVPRSRSATKKHSGKSKAAPSEVTLYPVVAEPQQLAYLANQGAIEMHVPTVRSSDLNRPDRVVIDLDPPPGGAERARRAALWTREKLQEHGLPSTPVATGSKGFHVVSPIAANLSVDELAVALQQLATLLAAEHPEELTTVFRVALRGGRVFVDWLRLGVGGSVIAPFSLRATPRATVAVPVTWNELEEILPDAFSLAHLDALRDRDDPLLELAAHPSDARSFIASVAREFEASGLELATFDRFRS